MINELVISLILENDLLDASVALGSVLSEQEGCSYLKILGPFDEAQANSTAIIAAQYAATLDLNKLYCLHDDSTVEHSLIVRSDTCCISSQNPKLSLELHRWPRL